MKMKWITLGILILGVMVIFGCATSKQTTTTQETSAPAPAPAPAPEPVKAVPVFDIVYFGQTKSNISPSAARVLDMNGAVLKENPKLKVELGGHADSKESPAVELSAKRAASVKNYLQDKFGIPASQLVTKGCGSSKPIADNSTAEGREKNRRVEFRVLQ